MLILHCDRDEFTTRSTGMRPVLYLVGYRFVTNTTYGVDCSGLIDKFLFFESDLKPYWVCIKLFNITLCLIVCV